MYTQSPIQVKRQLPVQVYKGQQTFDLALIVVAGSGPSLLRRNSLHSIRLDWLAIHKASNALLTPLSSLLDQHQVLFQDKLGTIEKEKATVLVQPDCVPKFFKPRQLRYANRDTVGSQLGMSWEPSRRRKPLFWSGLTASPSFSSQAKASQA